MFRFFKCASSNATSSVHTYSTAASPAGPLYLTDGDEGDDEAAAAACTCRIPAMRSGHLVLMELDASAVQVRRRRKRHAAWQGDAIRIEPMGR
ncbi:hypothetical protein E2562_010605 [Oryza meyeriana var. granulata]|uniref:Uncharacterized protein n=1 Tax=Oryza meyeriana var. granulata TaxID=110450 RepID=A0A6G1BUE5_9ORYZ|nr:hypothetical protein E2562_010605 [Oryza meyeriana var. granulata]